MSSSGRPAASPKPARGARVERHYARVIAVWILTLGALYAFQQYFS